MPAILQGRAGLGWRTPCRTVYNPDVTGDTSSFLAKYKSDVLQVIQGIDLDKVRQAIGVLAEARDQGRRIFVCGNGGSASLASHFACDMVKGASYERGKRFRIMALTDSLPTLTAYSNDVSYECVFVEQLKNFAEPGDVVMAISGSGNSPNVLRAVEYGNSLGCFTIALSGRVGGRLGPLAKLDICAGHPHMGRIEGAPDSGTHDLLLLHGSGTGRTAARGVGFYWPFGAIGPDCAMGPTAASAGAMASYRVSPSL